MNKKGFTLVEMLSVLVLLAVVLLLVLPAITSVLNKSKDTIYNSQINKILNSAYDYSLKNISMLPEYNETMYLTLNELKKNGLVDSDIKDPNTGELFENHLVISITNVGSGYKKTPRNSMLNGYYLYKVEDEFMATENFIENMPSITFEEYNTNPIVITLNIGDEYIPLEYNSLSSSGVDLTNSVIENITYKEKNVDEVSTSKAGIYHINYTVVDDNGYSNYVIVNVIVVDSISPVLTIPENTTISTSIDEYDLMLGVSCDDNSGECDISTSVSSDPSIENKYIIEYKATDPSGNTKISKRVITVE